MAVLRALEVGCVPEAQAAEELNCTSFFSFAMGSFFERDDSIGASCALQAADALGTSAIRCGNVFVFVLLARVCRAER